MTPNPEVLKRRLMRASGTIAMSRITSWSNLTPEQIEALLQLLNKYERLEMDNNKYRRMGFIR